MESYETIIPLYIIFMWLVVLHTFEEISQGIFGLKIGRLKMNQNKYLAGASLITTINMGTLLLIAFDKKVGLYLGLFTSSTLGILQALIHAIGYFREGRKTRNAGAGFYSSIPLAIAGSILLFTILQEI